MAGQPTSENVSGNRADVVPSETERILTKVVGSSSPGGLDVILATALQELYDSGHKVIDIKFAANPERFAAIILYQNLLQTIPELDAGILEAFSVMPG